MPSSSTSTVLLDIRGAPRVSDSSWASTVDGSGLFSKRSSERRWADSVPSCSIAYVERPESSTLPTVGSVLMRRGTTQSTSTLSTRGVSRAIPNSPADSGSSGEALMRARPAKAARYASRPRASSWPRSPVSTMLSAKSMAGGGVEKDVGATCRRAVTQRSAAHARVKLESTKRFGGSWPTAVSERCICVRRGNGRGVAPSSRPRAAADKGCCILGWPCSQPRLLSSREARREPRARESCASKSHDLLLHNFSRHNHPAALHVLPARSRSPRLFPVPRTAVEPPKHVRQAKIHCGLAPARTRTRSRVHPTARH